jgi:hypothetical protein
VVGGLLLSQVLTLYITPVIFLFFENLKERLARRGQGRDAPVALPTGGAALPAGPHAPLSGD